MKDHEIRELVNQLRDIAIEYHSAGQLREQIARVVRTAMLQAGNSPVIGTDLASGPDCSVEVRYVAPPGYVMVPKEPTEEMLAAAKEWTGLTSTAEVVYVKMLAAAPQEVPDGK
ncbi:hypothetical protein [Klebsiella variicola]